MPAHDWGDGAEGGEGEGGEGNCNVSEELELERPQSISGAATTNRALHQKRRRWL